MAASMDEDLDLVETDNYYAWLGLGKEASKDDINNAFRRLSRTYHPDKHASDPTRIAKAETLFTKIKRAHEVLIDPHRRAIYDTMGAKGLETEGWEVVPRQKTPQEILEEYERLAREREERRLETRTNPKGSISVGVDAVECFDSYEAADAMDYKPLLPHVEVSSMSISQSVECPLTVKDTAILSGNLSTQNGNGSGNISATMRRLTSHNGWVEAEISAGNGAALGLRGFRNLWRRGFGTMSGSLQFTPHGIRPGLTTVVATQLNKQTQGRLTWNAGRMSNMQTAVIWETENHYLNTTLQLGIRNTFVSLSYTRKFSDHDAKIKTVLRYLENQKPRADYWRALHHSLRCIEEGMAIILFKVGTYGLIFEYGADKKITQFSTLGASMMVGAPIGVTLKLKIHRGNQNFTFPVHLSDSVVPSAVFYGTVVPLVTFFVVRDLIVRPFLKAQKEKELKKKREANAERLTQKKRDAESAMELMTEMVDRCLESEISKGGLVIRKALYGKLSGDNVNDVECINVTRAVQALVKDSKVYLPAGTLVSELPGFYDPCIGEEKEIAITYEFRHKLHQACFSETEKILIPSKEHLVTNSSSSSDPSPT